MRKTNSKPPKLRPYGDIQLELEKLYFEAIYQHGMQLGDLLYSLYGWGRIHTESLERYTFDGSTPEFYYGPRREEGSSDESADS